MNISKAAVYFKALGDSASSLRATQLALLLDIAATGDTGISISERARKEGVSLPTFSRKLRNLMEVFEPSLIDFIIDKADRRYKRVILSDAGQTLVKEMFGAFGNDTTDGRLEQH
jgi:DNA-binding MarR family transcriptional regulator